MASKHSRTSHLLFSVTAADNRVEHTVGSEQGLGLGLRLKKEAAPVPPTPPENIPIHLGRKERSESSRRLQS